MPLTDAYNADRAHLPPALWAKPDPTYHHEQTIAGIPYSFGAPDSNNIVLLDKEPVAIELPGRSATYLVVVHRVADTVTDYLPGFADFLRTGDPLGSTVSEYTLVYADGSTVTRPVLRRFAIQQSEVVWGASPFAAVPALEGRVFPTASESFDRGEPARTTAGRSETRHVSGRDSRSPDDDAELPWLYALPNPHPDRPLQRLVCTPRDEPSIIYAVTSTEVTQHPFRPGPRRKLRLPLPPQVRPDAIGDVGCVVIDLGTVISARAALTYDHQAWLGTDLHVQPQPSTTHMVVEYEAREGAKLYLQQGGGEPVVHDLADLSGTSGGEGHHEVTVVEPAHRPVRIEVVDAVTQTQVPVRLHLHGAAGEYLPPRGHHRKVNPYWFEDNYAEHVTLHNQYSYINGACEADLPIGTVYVEIAKGYDYGTVRTAVEVTPDTDTLRFEIQRSIFWREQGWVSADTHVHFLSPHTALLEGRAEGVNVVNLLAAQWGEMFSNVGDFDGATTLGAREFGGDGEFLVRVGTENRMQVLGHISLLGYAGSMIHPLSTGGPTEAAVGDRLQSSLVAWARRCLEQGGLVVLPHAPHPQVERAAAIVLGVVDAIEMKTHNPLMPDSEHQLSPYGLADWYKYLNLGYQVPIVGGSDKMSAEHVLGGIRTYAQIGDQELDYSTWMNAVRRGNTFVTVGPMVSLQVEGQSPGTTIDLPAGGGSVGIDWLVESAAVPVDRVEVIVGGLVAEDFDVHGKLRSSGSTEVRVTGSTWIALRVRGGHGVDVHDVAAHTSALQVRVAGAAPFAPLQAQEVLDQIQGALAYVDTLATPHDVRLHRELRASIESAYNRLHQQLHRDGTFHDHALHPVHRAAEH